MKYAESSLIIDLFTLEQGLRSFIVSGVRSQKKRSIASYFSIFCELEIVAYNGDPEKLSRLKEYKFHRTYDELNSDVIKSSVAFFLIEVMHHTISDRTEHPELYDLLVRWLSLVNTQDHHHLANAPILYLLELSQLIGIEPLMNYEDGYVLNLNESTFQPMADLSDGQVYLSSTASYHVQELMKATNGDKWKVKIPKQERDDIIDGLLSYFRIHHPEFRELKSVSVLRSIF